MKPLSLFRFVKFDDLLLIAAGLGTSAAILSALAGSSNAAPAPSIGDLATSGIAQVKAAAPASASNASNSLPAFAPLIAEVEQSVEQPVGTGFGSVSAEGAVYSGVVWISCALIPPVAEGRGVIFLGQYGSPEFRAWEANLGDNAMTLARRCSEEGF